MEFNKVLRSRRSVRRFINKKVPLSVIKEIARDATYAPTNCNQQLWKIIAITKEKTKDRLVKEAYSSTIVRRAPVILVVAYDGWNYKEAIQGGSFAGQNILLSATSHGIGALSMNSFGNEEIIKKILNIPKEYIINCFVLLGYPDKVYNSTPPVKRRPIEDVLSFNACKMQHGMGRSYDTDKWNKKDLIDFQKYWCRKTFLGKRMDIIDDIEKQIIKELIENIGNKKKVIDFFSYDGGTLDFFPKAKITSVNLDLETENYTKSAVDIYCPEKKNDVNYVLFNNFKERNYDLQTLLFRIERLPPDLRKEFYAKAYDSMSKDGELIIVTRLPTLIFNLFYKTIIKIFGDDVRKTGIYSFWGPYKPMGKTTIIKELENDGFKVTYSQRYLFIPPFFNQALQMYIQFRKSGGTSYLHREKHNNIFTKVLDYIIRKQPKKNIFGSLLVIRAKKSEK